jgi:hypothetical protein
MLPTILTVAGLAIVLVGLLVRRLANRRLGTWFGVYDANVLSVRRSAQNPVGIMRKVIRKRKWYARKKWIRDRLRNLLRTGFP